MTKIKWHERGSKRFETGVSKAVLYPVSPEGEYSPGVAWNGITTITKAKSGAETNKHYADNVVYAALQSAEEASLTIEAFTYPDEFAKCDGSAELVPGVTFEQQSRKPFGLSYQTQLGDDIDGIGAGYLIHLFYNGLASPSERADTTINDSPEPIAFSWEVSSMGISGGEGFGNLVTVTIDSTKLDPAKLTILEDALYGTVSSEAYLPTPEELAELLA